MTTTEYQEGANPTRRITIGLLFGILTVVFIYLLVTGPFLDLLAGKPVSRLDAIGLPLVLVALVVVALAIRLAGQSGVPITIETGVIRFPRKGTWSVLFGLRGVVPTTHVERVEVMWATFATPGGGQQWSIYKIRLRTLDGGSYSKMYRVYSEMEQRWARETSSRLGSALGSKIAHIDALTKKPIPAAPV